MLMFSQSTNAEVVEPVLLTILLLVYQSVHVIFWGRDVGKQR